jgi:iron complex outermembrane recepter protein
MRARPRYITKDPSDKTAANVDIGGGNFGTLQTHAYLSGAILPGVLGSIAFAHDQHDGYTYDPTIRQHVNDQNTNGFRAKLLAKLSESWSIVLSVDGLRDNSATAYYTPVLRIVGGTLAAPVYAPSNINESYASQAPLNHSWAGGVSIKVTDVIDEHLTLKSITAARGFAQDPVNYNNDGEPLVPYNAANPTPVSIADNVIVYREKEWTQEFQAQGNYDKFDFASGLFLLYENFSSNRVGYVVSPTGAGTPDDFRSPGWRTASAAIRCPRRTLRRPPTLPTWAARPGTLSLPSMGFSTSSPAMSSVTSAFPRDSGRAATITARCRLRPRCPTTRKM